MDFRICSTYNKTVCASAAKITPIYKSFGAWLLECIMCVATKVLVYTTTFSRGGCFNDAKPQNGNLQMQMHAVAPSPHRSEGKGQADVTPKSPGSTLFRYNGSTPIHWKVGIGDKLPK